MSLAAEGATRRAKQAVATAAAPRAIGPYSQAVRTGDTVYCSGQIGLDPATGQLVPGGTIAEAERALANLVAVLAAAGLGPEDVVRTAVYLVDLSEFAAVNEVYARVLGAKGVPPARATVQVAALPRGARFEIEAIAVDGAAAPVPRGA